jgi:hypothetical protein
VRRLEEIAARLGLVVRAGLSEKERDIVFNTQVLVGPEGVRGWAIQRGLTLYQDALENPPGQQAQSAVSVALDPLADSRPHCPPGPATIHR